MITITISKPGVPSNDQGVIYQELNDAIEFEAENQRLILKDKVCSRHPKKDSVLKLIIGQQNIFADSTGFCCQQFAIECGFGPGVSKK